MISHKIEQEGVFFFEERGGKGVRGRGEVGDERGGVGDEPGGVWDEHGEVVERGGERRDMERECYIELT